MPRPPSSPASAAPRNCLALLIASSAALTLIFNFDPQPAGAALEPDVAAAPLLLAPPASASKVAAEDLVEGRPALLQYLTMLQDGCRRLERIPNYSATFTKQERLDDGELQDQQTIALKLRHQPFSVYMKWRTGDVGREILYVDGELENRMLVKKGGQLGRVLPALRLDPTGSLAMGESRHPVTQAGLLELAKTILAYRTKDVERPDGEVTCRMTGETEFAGRKCVGFCVEYRDAQVQPIYRKSVTYIDRELSVPIYVRNYTWPSETTEVAAVAAAEEEPADEPSDEESADELEDEEVADSEDEELEEAVAQPAGPVDPELATLIEFYTYTNLQVTHPLPAAAFDATNTEYTFKR